MKTIMKIKALLLASILLYPGVSSCSDKEITGGGNNGENPEQEIPAITGTPLLWGFDDAGATHDPIGVLSRRIIKEFGFDLVVNHYSPTNPSYDVNITNLNKRHNFYKSLDAKWIINLENSNWSRAFIDEKGLNWYQRDDGRHYFQFPDEILEAFSGMDPIPGLMYDEPEHMQIHRCSATIADFEAPFILSETAVNSLEEASDRFAEEAAKIVDLHNKYGIKMYSEHVFPVLYHPFAKGGFIPVSKILKENNSPAYIATAMGAAIQYGTIFWLTPDFWHLGTYPGHSLDTYRSALLLAYHMGAEGIYTENLSYDQDKKGAGSLVLLNDNKTNYTVTEYGKIAKWFRIDYAPATPRSYSFKDLKPRVVIIRQDDTTWGQTNSGFPNWLYGVKTWKTSPITLGWLEIWHLISNGAIPSNGLSWHNRDIRPTPYRLLYPLDGVVVFDETVREKHIKDAELIFLTGVRVSAETVGDVEKLVKQGAVCVAQSHLVPDRVRNGLQAGVFSDGEGKWVVVNDSFLAEKELVNTHIQPFLPTADYIRYRFGNTEVKFSPINNNNNDLKVEVKTVSP